MLHSASRLTPHASRLTGSSGRTAQAFRSTLLCLMRILRPSRFYRIRFPDCASSGGSATCYKMSRGGLDSAMPHRRFPVALFHEFTSAKGLPMMPPSSFKWLPHNSIVAMQCIGQTPLLFCQPASRYCSSKCLLASPL
jgi:hypothetical protein